MNFNFGGPTTDETNGQQTPPPNMQIPQNTVQEPLEVNFDLDPTQDEPTPPQFETQMTPPTFQSQNTIQEQYQNNSVPEFLAQDNSPLEVNFDLDPVSEPSNQGSMWEQYQQQTPNNPPMTPPMPQEASMDVNFDLDPIQDTTPTPQFDMEETPQFDLQPKAPTFEPQNTVQEPTFVPQNTENNQEQTQQPMQFEPEKTTPISAQHRENEPQLTSIVGLYKHLVDKTTQAKKLSQTNELQIAHEPVEYNMKWNSSEHFLITRTENGQEQVLEFVLPWKKVWLDVMLNGHTLLSLPWGQEDDDSQKGSIIKKKLQDFVVLVDEHLQTLAQQSEQSTLDELASF